MGYWIAKPPYWDDKPPYWKEPIDRCDLCGASLLYRDRYRVHLYLKSEPFTTTPFKTLHLCRECLRTLLGSKEYRKRFRIRYRKMPRLGYKHSP